MDHLKYCDAVDDYPVTSLAAKRGTHQEGLYLQNDDFIFMCSLITIAIEFEYRPNKR